MRVIVCGAGQVGSNIARYLSRFDTNVTMIDIDPALIAAATTNLDVRGIVGHAGHPDVLKSAGAADADLIIAVTQVDEINMVACQVAHTLFQVPKKIARVRQGTYLRPEWRDLFQADHMPIDHIIAPEVEVAESIQRRLAVPGAFEVIPMGKGRAVFVGVRCLDETPILETPLDHLADLFPQLSMRILVLARGSDMLIPTGEEKLQAGDEVYFVAQADQVERVLALFGHEEQEGRRMVIMGGGNIGLNLAQRLEAQNSSLRIKLIEVDNDQAKYAAQHLSRTVVLQGDALEAELMAEAGVDKTETLVAASNDDELNILAALQAKRLGAERAVAIVNRQSISSLVGQLGIDVVVSPRLITVSSILRYVRQGRIRAVHSVGEGFGEIFDIEAAEGAEITGKTVQKIEKAGMLLVGGIVRDEEFIPPKPEEIIRQGDRVVLLSHSDFVKKAEKLFSVGVGVF
ncbi:MAG: Trk system potassium transporter TrkA [Alphaproteobacteria bacterium]